MPEITFTLPLTVESTELVHIKGHRFKVKTVLKDAAGRRWLTEGGFDRSYVELVDGYYVGVEREGMDPAIVAGPFDEKPTLTRPNQKLYTFGYDGEYKEVAD